MNKTNIYVSVRTEEECKAFLNIANKAKEPIYEDAEFDFINGVVDENQPFIHFDGEEWIRDQEHNLLDMGKTLITLDQLESMLCGKEEGNSIPKINYPVLGYAPGNYYCTCANCKTPFQGDKRAVQCEVCALRIETSSLRKELEGKIEAQQRLRECSFELLENITQSTEELNWIKLKDSLENYKTKLKAIFNPTT